MSTSPANATRHHVAIIGGGPAGLMAAEELLKNGFQVDLYDSQRSVGRKFLLAGIGGLNLTHSLSRPDFDQAFGDAQEWIRDWLDQLDNEGLREWAAKLGIETFVGTSGRVFPVEKKAAPLLRRWLSRLRDAGLKIHAQHRWIGWKEDALQFETPDGPLEVTPDATVLAMGGASWPQLGSDGSWVTPLNNAGIDIATLEPTNCGFDVNWSKHLRENAAGQPLKPVTIKWRDRNGQFRSQQGECVLTEYGIEGSAIYPACPDLRAQIAKEGSARILLDLFPHSDVGSIVAKLKTRGSRSLSDHFKRSLQFNGGRLAVFNEFFRATSLSNSELAAALKNVEIELKQPRPLAEVISTAGGVKRDAMGSQLMLTNKPGTFCAGEMLDWEAPTGGYLLTACFASGIVAAHGVRDFLNRA